MGVGKTRLYTMVYIYPPVVGTRSKTTHISENEIWVVLMVKGDFGAYNARIRGKTRTAGTLGSTKPSNIRLVKR